MRKWIWRFSGMVFLSLVFVARVLAHDPLVVGIDVDATGDTVRVTIEVKQWALLAALDDERSLFADVHDLDRLRLRLEAYCRSGIDLRCANQPVALTMLAEPITAVDGELPDPLRLVFTGHVPKVQVEMHAVFPLFSQLTGTPSIIDNVRVGGTRAAPLLRSVKPGDALTWSLLPAGSADVSAASAQSNTAVDFIRLGFLHIMPEGTDHILFVLGLFLLSPKLRPLLTQITAFTVAHSLTLGLAMAGVFTLPARIVEPLIALSIAVVAAENLWSREVRPWRWMLVFAFGLVHGLGFAGALREMHLPPGGIALPLVSFNVGVEAGQLSVVAIVAALSFWMWRRPWYTTRVAMPASVLIGCIGLFWAIQRGLGYGIEP